MTPERKGSPFSILSVTQVETGWREELLDKSSKVRVFFPKEAASTIVTKVTSSDMPKDVDVRVVSADEIEQGYFDAPEDTINLARINTDILNLSGDLSNTIIQKARSFLELQRKTDADFPAELLSFSKEEQLLIVMPSLSLNA